jgi:hypothetical protein
MWAGMGLCDRGHHPVPQGQTRPRRGSHARRAGHQGAGIGAVPLPVCLTQDNQWYVVTGGRCGGVSTPISPHDRRWMILTPPADLPPKPGQHRKGDEATPAPDRLENSPTAPPSRCWPLK